GPPPRAAREEPGPEAILAAQEAVPGRPPGPPDPAAVLGSPSQLRWAPWVDGDVVTASPGQAARAARPGAAPRLAGATANEMNPGWMAEEPLTRAAVRDGLSRAGVPGPQLERYLGHY